MKYIFSDKLSSIKKSKPNGFFSLSFIFVLILISTFLFSISFLHLFSQKKDLSQSICFKDAVDIQKLLVNSEKLLISLNPVSTTLRTKLLTQKAALALALASQNAALAAHYTTLIQQTVLEQKKLDFIQKNIIFSSQENAKFKYLKLIKQLSAQQTNIDKIWAYYFTSINQIHTAKIPSLAVKPDSLGGQAPNYELAHQIKHQQDVVFYWQNSMITNLNVQKIFSAHQTNYIVCRIGFEKEGSSWLLKIKMDSQ